MVHCVIPLTHTFTSICRAHEIVSLCRINFGIAQHNSARFDGLPPSAIMTDMTFLAQSSEWNLIASN